MVRHGKTEHFASGGSQLKVEIPGTVFLPFLTQGLATSLPTGCLVRHHG